ncbi:MAG: aminopeptidase [Erysipelotrichaceae bacterium]|nr:aminopeptidase [Erysipelotrichaceae bacterium]
MDQLRKEKFAQMLIKVGVNLQPGQYLILQTIPEGLELAQEVAKEAFKAKAKDVIMIINDPITDHIRGLNADVDTLRSVPDHKLEQLDYYLRQDAVQLSLMGSYPTLNNDVDTNKLIAISQAGNDVRNVVRKYIHKNVLQWTGSVVATQDWANAVYPELSDVDAFKALEDDLCKMVRVDDHSDVIANWKTHCERLGAIAKKLNEYCFKSLHITSELNTDITLDLVKDHIWTSAGQINKGKHQVSYVANMPTEEIFTDPNCYSANGIVYASRPLMIAGKLVTDFNITFKDGYAVACQASQNEDILKDALFKNDATRRLGEVALVSKHSPIRKMNKVYFNGLIDENAASHLAFGTSFPSCIKNGEKMTNEELLAKGVNVAISHNDFMIGTDKFKVVGIKDDQTEVVIMEDGDFII